MKIKVEIPNALRVTCEMIGTEIYHRDIEKVVEVICAGLGIDYDMVLGHMAEGLIIESVQEAQAEWARNR